jgi:hypothetical protein
VGRPLNSVNKFFFAYARENVVMRISIISDTHGSHEQLGTLRVHVHASSGSVEVDGTKFVNDSSEYSLIELLPGFISIFFTGKGARCLFSEQAGSSPAIATPIPAPYGSGEIFNTVCVISAVT